MARWQGTYDDFQKAIQKRDIPRRIAIHTKVIPNNRFFGKTEKGHTIEKTIDDGTGIKTIINRYDKFGKIVKEKRIIKHGIERIEKEFVIKKEKRKLLKDIKVFLKNRSTVQVIFDVNQLIINDISEIIKDEE